MSLSDIKKIDEVLEYYIKEIYNRLVVYEANTNENIEIMLEKSLDELLKNSFVIDYKVIINLRTKAELRDVKLEVLLDDIEDEGSFIEVLYQMQDRSMYSVRISEEELIKHRDRFNR